MNNKRLLCLIIVVSFLTQQFVFGYYSDTRETPYEKPVNVLSAFGILKGYDDGTFKSANPVTRAEFVDFVIRFLNLGAVESQNLTYYNDVDNDYWALSAINTAAALGLVAGFEGRIFRPEDNITVSEALKIVMSSLGYNAVAQEKGGYPVGYLSLANQYGVLSGVKTAYNDNATRGDAVFMLYNALEVKLAVGTSRGVEISDKTILKDTLKIQKRSGQITASKYAQITPTANLKSDEVAIDSVTHKISDPFMHELVGYYITFYTKETDDEEYIIVYYELINNRNSPILVWAEDILSKATDFSVSRFVYRDEEGKNKFADLDADYVIKNGETIKFDLAETLAIKDGNILLIDADGNGRYETIFVNEAKTVVVDRVNTVNMHVYYKYSGGGFISFEEDGLREVSLYSSDEEIAVSRLKEWDILTVYENPSKNKLVAYVSQETVSGIVEEITYDSDGVIITVNGVAYDVGHSYFTLLEEETQQALKPGVGQSVKLYFDIQSKIAAIQLLGSTEEKYGLLINAAKKGFNFELLIYPEDGSVSTMLADNRVLVDDGVNQSYYSGDALYQKLADTKVPEPDNADSENIYQIIRFRTNGEGKVNKITVAKLSQDGRPLRDDNLFTRDFLSSAAVTNGADVINGAYKIPKATAKIFYVPLERCDYAKYKKDATFVKSTNYTIALYDMNRHNFVAAALVFQPKASDYNLDPKYNPYFIADRITIAINDEGGTVYRAYGIYDRQVRSFDFDTRPSFIKADVYQFGILDGKVAKIQPIYKAATDSYARSTPLPNGLGDSGKATDQVFIGYLEVQDVTDNTVVLTDGSDESLLNLSTATRYTIYDKERDDVRRADRSEIAVGDRVVIRTFELTVGDLVIIR